MQQFSSIRMIPGRSPRVSHGFWPRTQLREALIQKGLARARRFTWESVAQKTLELYAALA